MDALYPPPIGLARVRYRKKLHFGQDDPLFHPQPFNRSIAHLALIPLPSCDPNHKLRHAWVIPTADDFEPRAALDICPGLGKLALSLRSSFEFMVVDALERSKEHKDDFYICNQSMQLRFLLGRLDTQWATQSDTFLRFATAQRQFLELVARLDWIHNYRDRFMRPNDDPKDAAVPGIMGAFADSPEVAEALFQLGIPVWYTRPISRDLDVRVDRVVNFTQGTDTLTLSSGFKVDLSEATPPHRVIYNGLANKPERYLAMSKYTSSLQQYPSLFGSDEPRSSTSVARVSLKLPGSESSQHKPYEPRRKGTLSKQGNNTFLDTSPLMPRAVPAWQAALSALSDHNQSLPAANGFNGGYVLPPSRLLSNPQNDMTRGRLFCNWLKLRHLLIYCLSTRSRRLSNKQWRCLLEVGGSGSTNINDTTKSGKQFGAMRSLLQDLLDQSSLVLRLENLLKSKVEWNREQLEDGAVPEVRVAEEILWELNELNFRQELLVLDTQLDESRMSTFDRQRVLDGCWRGTAEYAMLKHPSEGLCGATIQARTPYLSALHRVMSTWRIEKPLELLDPFPTDETAHNYAYRVEKVERALASVYTSVFLHIFGRAATVPRLLS
ncbi:hypothetical protein PQX77_002825 [Marasmius sp. AFHP31]|nr:hypothetical protein PQX77_002825 [Marasmius sp. AFHP31]